MTTPAFLQVPALGNCNCNSEERNHLLDVRVIIVICDISRSGSPKFGPSVYSRAGTLRPNHSGSDTLGFQTSRYILRIRSNPNLPSDATVWAYRGFYVLAVCKFPILAAVRRNAILPECRFSGALLNTFLQQLKGASRTGNIPTERSLYANKTGFNTLRLLRQIMKCLLLFN